MVRIEDKWLWTRTIFVYISFFATVDLEALTLTREFVEEVAGGTGTFFTLALAIEWIDLEVLGAVDIAFPFARAA